MKREWKWFSLVLVLTTALLVSCAAERDNDPLLTNQVELKTAPCSEEIIHTLPSSMTTTEGDEDVPASQEILSAISPLIEAQKEFYTITGVEIRDLVKKGTSADGRMYHCDVVIFMKIKYSTMDELPHVQGLLDATGFANLEECRKATKSSIDEKTKSIANEIMIFIETVEFTFGKEFDAGFSIALLTDEFCNVKEVYGVGDDGVLFALENYFPQSAEEMYQNGVQQGQQIIDNAENN